jgi:hypothetical protein
MSELSALYKDVFDLVTHKKADVEVKLDDLGHKYAVVEQDGQVIYKTSEPEEIERFEYFLRDPEDFLRMLKKEEIEDDFNADVLHQIQEQGGSNELDEPEESEETPDSVDKLPR